MMATGVKEQQEILKVVELFNEIPSFGTLFGQLNDICQSLITVDSTTHASIWTIFELIWQNYLILLENDELIDEYGREHHEFLRRFLILSTLIVTKKSSREIFFTLFDRLNQSKRIHSYLENPSSNDILNHICRTFLYISFHICNDFNIILTNHDLVKYQNNLFNEFIRYFDRDIRRREISREDNLLIGQLRIFLLNRSSITPAIPIFIDTDCSQACLRWLMLPYLHTVEYEFCLRMLYNIARHDDGIILLKKLNCVNIVRQFQKMELPMQMDVILDKEWYSKISRILDMIFALLIDPDELYREEIIKRIVSLTRLSLEHPQHICQEYHISELLIILMKLCIDESLMDYILQHELCPELFFLILNRLLTSTEKDLNELAINALANIFWSMSFDQRYQKHLIQNLSLLKRLTTFHQTQPMNNDELSIHRPYQMSSLKRTLDGIWQNLYPGKLEIKPRRSSQQSICSVMISYSSVNRDFCREFYNVLNTLPELSIYVDFKTGKYSWKEAVEMIEQSDVVLFLLSNEFYQSKSCRQEMIYVTDSVKKLYFPIFIDRDFRASSWLQKRIVRLKSIRFGEQDFLSTCEDLLKLINENLSIHLSLINHAADVKNWNDQEIKQWFINQRIRLDLYEFYHFQNGQELLLYAQAIFTSSWLKEYERIQERANLSQEEFLQFIYALKRLLK